MSRVEVTVGLYQAHARWPTYTLVAIRLSGLDEDSRPAVAGGFLDLKQASDLANALSGLCRLAAPAQGVDR